VRARNIKPALFKNEVLGQADPLYTVLFEGLWCMADREGRLEDRPARIKAEVFPYRTEVDVEACLQWLQDGHFIDRYMTERGGVVQVVEFSKHQRPHKNEPPSTLLDKNHKVKVRKTSTNGGRASTNVRRARADSLFSDSGYLNADTGSLIDRSLGRLKPPDSDPAFEQLKVIYPKRAGDQRWTKAFSAFKARIAEGVTREQILSGAQRYADHVRAMGKERTEFVKQAATFLGTERGFLEAWPIPPTKGETLRDKNADATNEWLSRAHGKH
jgi:hypothetical protein